MSLIPNILFFTSSRPAKAVLNRSIRFSEVRTTVECNSRLVSAYFSCARLDHLINSFGITRLKLILKSKHVAQSLILVADNLLVVELVIIVPPVRTAHPTCMEVNNLGGVKRHYELDRIIL